MHSALNGNVRTEYTDTASIMRTAQYEWDAYVDHACAQSEEHCALRDARFINLPSQDEE